MSTDKNSDLGQGQKTHESVRVFESDFLESLTHIHPIWPLLIWTPITLGFIYQNVSTYQHSVGTIIVLGLISLFVWTASEYLLHRYVFHFPAKSALGKRFVYLFHGLHHDDPQDPTRLVMPPVPAVLISSVLYFIFALFIPQTYMNGFFGFFMIGYLIYDYIHYATHHFPMKSKVARYLKKYHLQHHYSHSPSKYGVSNPLWDYVFGTVTAEETTLNQATNQ